MNYIIRLLLISFFAFSSGIFAGTTGKIVGQITDALTGDPLPFVNVIVVGTNLGAAADVDGYYSILNVPPGTYSIKASAIGYNSVTVEEVAVSIDLTTTVNFQLNETSIELGEDIVVTATKPLVKKDLTASTSIVGDELISELPVTEINDVLELQAGIVVSPGGDIHVRGGRSGQVVYQIDGVPITDSYDGSTVVEVNSNAVQELQVISGAFNAEYGQALSGVVNLVTKDGSNDFKGSVSAYAGDYVSNKSDVFWNIDDFDPISIRNTEFSLSGPVLNDRLFFFTNLRYYKNEGYLYGRRVFLVTDYANEVSGSGGTEFNINQNGDSSFVPMNSSNRWYGQGKLTLRIMSGMKLSYNYILERQNYFQYDHNRRLTPDNNLDRNERSYSNIVTLNHAISNKSFYTLSFSYYFKDYRHYLYENIHTGDPEDPTQYFVDNRFLQNPPYSFQIGGTDYGRFTRNSGTYSIKLDWPTQLTKEINLQIGGEYKQHRIYYQNINLIPKIDPETGQLAQPFDVTVPLITTTDYDEYLRKPKEISGYLQSKFEAFNLIFNAGIRFDAFYPDGKILTDPTDPNIVSPLKPSNQFNDLNGNGVFDPSQGETIKTVADRAEYWYKDASIKYQLSPRLGLAFPITDKGVIHFSYGHFFQLPRYEYLYTNPDFEIGVGSGNQGLFGNANLNPQKTVKGEIGLQQQIGDDMAVDLTMFFEDFRDLTGTQTEEILVFGRDRSYSQYANSDFGLSKGVIFKFTKRLSKGFATNLDYTYSVTKGNASNPADARNAVLGGALPETFIAPLNWDQTHTLNLSLTYSKPGSWGFSMIGNFYSGQPYTPAVNKNTRVTQNAFPRNSASKPSIFNVDLRVYKDFSIGPTKLSLFMKVFNLLDLDNPVNVYEDSGDPYFSFDEYEAEQINPTLYYNTLEQLYTDPSRFSEPRRVELGLSFYF